MCAKIIEMTSLLEKRTRGGGAKKPAAESRSRWLFKAIFNLPFRGPQRTSSARVTVVVLCVCVCVCLSVYDYSRTTGYVAANERYQR